MDKSEKKSLEPGSLKGSEKKDDWSGTPTLKELMVVILSALACTIIMFFLDANERLYLFTRPYGRYGIDDFIVFFPSFLALGFLLFSYRQIEALRSEMIKRRQAEGALLESESRYRELSITDELTKLHNARYFHKKLDAELDRAIRYNLHLSLLLLDIDDFKRYNDQFGHLEGDKVLGAIGDIIQRSMRGADSAFRYGGEEFTVILPETPAEGAITVAERIRRSFESYPFCPESKNRVPMTISIGVAQFGPGEDPESLVERADKNMYTAKKKGKNQTFFSR
ncbi:MAG: GGDEF domain-containing protein [Pseudomonadota bacterium]